MCAFFCYFIVPLSFSLVAHNLKKKVFNRVDGFVNLVLSEPLLKQRTNRHCWGKYETQDQCAEAMKKLNGFKVCFVIRLFFVSLSLSEFLFLIALAVVFFFFRIVCFMFYFLSFSLSLNSRTFAVFHLSCSSSFQMRLFSYI